MKQQTSGNNGSRKSKAGATAAVRTKPTRHTPFSEAERMERVATAAYFLAEARGFEPGHELEDWFTAEAGMGLGSVSGKFAS